MILPGFKQMMTKLTTNSNVVSETQPNLVTRKLRQPDLKPLPRCIKHCYSDDAVHVVIAFLRPKLLQGGARPFPCIISKSIRRLRAFSRVTCVTKWTKRSKCRISGRMTFQLQNGPCAAPAGINANGRDGFAWRWTKTVSREGNYNRENALKNDHSGFVRLGYIATKWDRFGDFIWFSADMVPHLPRRSSLLDIHLCPPAQFASHTCMFRWAVKITSPRHTMTHRTYHGLPDRTCFSPRNRFFRLPITFAPVPVVAKPLLQENGWA